MRSVLPYLYFLDRNIVEMLFRRTLTFGQNRGFFIKTCGIFDQTRKPALNKTVSVDIFNVWSYTLLVAARRYTFASTSRIFRLPTRALFRTAVTVSARSFRLAARCGSVSKKETGGNVGERERFHVPPRFRRAKGGTGHSSILASRADGLSLPLPLWPSFLFLSS